MKFGDVEVKGKKFEIEVGEDGRFFANNDGSSVYAPTLDQLKTKLAAQLSRAKVKLSIPFVRWDGEETTSWNGTKRGGLLKGEVTGIHASNRNLLVKFEGRKGVEQESSYQANRYFRPECADELVRLAKVLAKAKEEYNTFADEHKLDPRAEIRKQLGGEALEDE